MFTSILLTKEERIATITLNKPESRNALDVSTRQDLLAALDQLAADSEVRVVIVTGAGDKSFAAGADIKAFVGAPTSEMLDRTYGLGSLGLFKKLENFDKPTIAAVNGYALGGGCELAMCCDMRIASETAKFGQPEIALGIMPGGGGTQRLPRLIGLGRAKELCFTGDMIDAKEAERFGLVNKVVPPDRLMAVAKEVAAKIASKSPLALKYAKRSLNMSWQMELDAALTFEAYSFGACFSTEDKEEGVKAFLEKRKPVFKGK